MPDQYIWLAWSIAFLVPWIVLFVRYPTHRRAMWWASLFTAPFDLTEPTFVPEYWMPPPASLTSPRVPDSTSRV